MRIMEVVIIESDMDNNKIDHKISPDPSLLKRGKYLPLWKRGIKGDFEDREMLNDNLTFADIEMAINNGRINRKFTKDPRGTRYETIGRAGDGREIAIICRIKSTDKLLLITTYAVED